MKILSPACQFVKILSSENVDNALTVWNILINVCINIDIDKI